MTRRRCFRLGGLLLVGLAIALLFPQIRYSIPGWLRGDHRYRGLPTSYWSGAIRDWHKALEDWARANSTPRRPLSPLLSRWFSMPGRTRAPSSPSVLGGGRESIPVLTELLRDKEPLVRIKAANSLASLGPAAREAAPALRQTLARNEESSDALEQIFRVSAAAALWGIERQPEPSVSALVAILKKGGAATPHAVGALGSMGPDAKSAVPILMNILKSNSADSELALCALGKIGPEAKAAVPAVLELARAKSKGTRDPYFCYELRSALENIDPEAAAQLDPQSGQASDKQAAAAQRQP